MGENEEHKAVKEIESSPSIHRHTQPIWPSLSQSAEDFNWLQCNIFSSLLTVEVFVVIMGVFVSLLCGMQGAGCWIEITHILRSSERCRESDEWNQPQTERQKTPSTVFRSPSHWGLQLVIYLQSQWIWWWYKIKQHCDLMHSLFSH